MEAVWGINHVTHNPYEVAVSSPHVQFTKISPFNLTGKQSQDVSIATPHLFKLGLQPSVKQHSTVQRASAGVFKFF